MNLKCIVIDDEPYARDLLSDYIGKLPFLELCGCYSSGLDALSVVKQEQINLVFLDIQMPDITGIDFLKALTNPPKVIFTTAHAEYALDGYELNVLDYLLKPFDFNRFVKSVDKAFVAYSAHSLPMEEHSSADYLFVKDGRNIVRLAFSDILFVKGLKDYVKIKTEQGQIISLLTLKGLEEKLPSHRFARVHNSYIVSIEKIDAVVKNKIKIGDDVIPISNSYRKHFLRQIGNSEG
ncbi:MAG: LytTR family DNA-binding domain-containing protein [Bacteroidota bacterium]